MSTLSAYFGPDLGVRSPYFVLLLWENLLIAYLGCWAFAIYPRRGTPPVFDFRKITAPQAVQQLEMVDSGDSNSRYVGSLGYTRSLQPTISPISPDMVPHQHRHTHTRTQPSHLYSVARGRYQPSHGLEPPLLLSSPTRILVVGTVAHSPMMCPVVLSENLRWL